MIRFIGILLAMFTIGVMQLILAAAMPFIVKDIGGESLYSWVFSAYMLASLVTIPIFSKLADIYGKSKFFIFGLVLFGLGTLYGAFAPNMTHLVIARVIQGLSAGILTPIALSLISEMFPQEKRGKMIGVFGFVQLLSNLISAPVGGFITRQLGWHWIFMLTLILVVISVACAAIGEKSANNNKGVKLSDIDFAGGIIFGVFCVSIVALSKVISYKGRIDVNGIILLAITVCAFIAVVVLEKKHENPILKLEFFKTNIIRRSIFSSVIAGAIMYGLITILPICGTVFEKQGYRVNESQILFLYMIGITIGILFSSRYIKKLNSLWISKISWVVITACSILMLYSISVGSLIMFNIFNALMGFSTGCVMSTFLINSQNAVNDEDRTVLSGIVQLGRYLGASIGVTILIGIIPDINSIAGISQFWGAFLLLVGLTGVGLLNEFV